MKNSIKLLVLVISAILILGIEGCPQEESEDIINGLQMKFIEGAPPSNIIIGDEVAIYADVKNGGGSHIGAGKAKFYLGGIGPNLDGVTEKLSNEKSLDSEMITPRRIVFAESAKSNLERENPFMLPVTLTSCYHYATLAEIDVCIGSNKTDVCAVSGEKVKEGDNTQSPVQVTSLKEDVLGKKLIITFIIENVGVMAKPGEVYIRNADCDAIYGKDVKEVLKKGIIEVNTNLGKNEEIECNLEDGTTSIGITGKAKVTCQKILEEKEEYLTTFKIGLQYTYVDSIATSWTLIPA